MARFLLRLWNNLRPLLRWPLVLLRGVIALAESLDFTPVNAPTPVGCSDASVTVLPVPFVDHVFISIRSVQSYIGGYTDAYFTEPSDLLVL